MKTKNIVLFTGVKFKVSHCMSGISDFEMEGSLIQRVVCIYWYLNPA